MISCDTVIIGAGPVGLFQVFELGLLGLDAHVVDAVPHAGGQCIELYPDKPIYDIPAVPVCSGRELIARLQQQIRPFAPQFHLGHTVTSLERMQDGRFRLQTSGGLAFDASAVIIAGGLGAFAPRTLNLPEAAPLVGRTLHYKVAQPALFAVEYALANGYGEVGDDSFQLLRDAARVSQVGNDEAGHTGQQRHGLGNIPRGWSSEVE